jgi:osmoprotectant transport system substrate-binding protein
MSDLSTVASQFVLGGPPECPTRPFCQAGLEKTYGLKFKSFKALDVGGPLTKSALDSGAIQIGLILSSDGSIPVKGYVVLDDDKHLQTVDNVVPVIRTAKLTDEVKAAVNRASAALDTPKLVALNKAVDVDKSDPADVATKFLQDNNLG